MWKITQINKTKNDKEKDKNIYKEYIKVKQASRQLTNLGHSVSDEPEYEIDSAPESDDDDGDDGGGQARLETAVGLRPIAVEQNREANRVKESMDQFLRSKRKMIKQDFSKESKDFELSVYNKFTKKTYKEKFKLKDTNDSKTKKELFLSAKNKIRKQIKKDKGINLESPTVVKIADGEEVELSVQKGKWRAPFDSTLEYEYDYVQSTDYKLGHVKPGDFLNMYRLKKIETIYQEKKPTSSKHHMGIEFEFISKANKGTIAKELAEAKLHEYVMLTEDGSLRSDDQYPYMHELCVVAPEDKLEDVLTSVTDIINKLGSKVNKSCGTHVHIDVRNRDRNTVFNNLTKVQDILFAMQSRERVANQHCKKVNESDFTKVLAAYPKNSGSRSYRYLGINPHSYEKHQTIEVRIHSGTINKRKIVNWCKILMAIANKDKSYETTCTDLHKFQDRFGIDDKLLAYINERIKKFNPDGKKHLDLDEAV